MNIFEKIAEKLGWTFNVHIAKSENLKFIPMQKMLTYSLYALITITTILLIIWLIRHLKEK